MPLIIYQYNNWGILLVPGLSTPSYSTSVMFPLQGSISGSFRSNTCCQTFSKLCLRWAPLPCSQLCLEGKRYTFAGLHGMVGRFVLLQSLGFFLKVAKGKGSQKTQMLLSPWSLINGCTPFSSFLFSWFWVFYANHPGFLTSREILKVWRNNSINVKESKIQLASNRSKRSNIFGCAFHLLPPCQKSSLSSLIVFGPFFISFSLPLRS